MVQSKQSFDEITEEIEEIWKRDQDGNEEAIRLNGKYVWETAKRVCDFITSNEELIIITMFGGVSKSDEEGDERHKGSSYHREEKNVDSEEGEK